MPPPAPPPAVVSRKQDFIQAQTRLLEQPLEPSDAWRTVNQDAEERLPDPVVRAVMLRLNHKLRQHELRVHARQASQHVAEQINTLYWNAAEAVAERDGGSQDVPEALSAYSDLTDHQTIAGLPPSWESERDVEAYPGEAQKYEELADRLLVSTTRRQEAIDRVARLRNMHEILRPFGGEVQPNLVTRGGGVEAELERQKILLARVGGRIDQLLSVAARDKQRQISEDGEADSTPGVSGSRHARSTAPEPESGLEADSEDLLADDFYVDEQARAYELLNMF